jgi:hypothetical protein
VTEREGWLRFVQHCGRRAALSVARAEEHFCVPRWTEISNSAGRRIQAYADFVMLERLCDEVKRGDKPAA